MTAPDTAAPFRLGHRPALDGMRGIAILLVFVHHSLTFLAPTHQEAFPGGFLGVDVFFTLSGFLITTLLLEEFQRSGRISLLGFYRRRALRLLPAVAVLLVVSTGYVLATGWPRRPQLTTVIAVATYSTNWFANANSQLTLGFGHMWSLAIEEQFYLLWPLVLLVVLGLALRRHASPRLLASGLAVAVVAVAVWRAVLRDSRPWTQVYFRTDARLDQLLVGALLAVALHQGWVNTRKPAWLAAAGLLGLGYLAMSIDAFGTAYYDWGALLASLCTVALILGTLDGRGPVARLLRLRPLRDLGLISYSLYLWHVPIIVVVLRYFGGRLGSPALIALALTLSLAAAIASHLVVERPALRLKSQLEARSAAREKPPLVVAGGSAGGGSSPDDAP